MHAIPHFGILLCLCPCAVAQGSAKPAKRWSFDATRLVAEAFGADAKKSAAARTALEDALPADRKSIAEALRVMPFAAAKKGKVQDRLIREEIEAPEAATKKATFLVELPKAYDGKKPFPALFRLHGSGGTAMDFAKVPSESKTAFVCVTPEIPSEQRIGWNEPGGYEFLDRLFRHVLKTYCVDPNRIYVSGHSAGGGASVMLAELWPHRIAGVYAMSWAQHAFHMQPESCMQTLAGIPAFFAVGLADTPERIGAFRKMEEFAQQNRAPWTFAYAQGKGHDYMREHDDQAYAFLAKAERKAAPSEIRGVFFLYGNAIDVEPITSRRWWLESKPNAYDAAKGTTFHAKASDNAIEIDAPTMRAGSVLLTDGLVDLDKPVIVKLNGKTVHEGIVDRSPKFLLDWFDSERDRGQLYWNRVSFGN